MQENAEEKGNAKKGDDKRKGNGFGVDAVVEMSWGIGGEIEDCGGPRIVDRVNGMAQRGKTEGKEESGE